MSLSSHTGRYVDFVGAIVILLAKYLKINLKYKKNTMKNFFMIKLFFKYLSTCNYLFKKYTEKTY